MKFFFSLGPKIDNFSCNSLQFCCNLESNSIKTKTQIHASENIISWIIELLNDHTTFFDDASLDLSKEEILACVKKLVIKLENIIHINSCNVRQCSHQFTNCLISHNYWIITVKFH